MRFKVTVVSASERWESEVDSLTLPAQRGKLTLLYNHTAIMGKLAEGEIITGSFKKKIKQGFFEFRDNQAKVLVDEE